MKVDNAKLDRRIRMLIAAAEAKNDMTHTELSQYLTWTSGTLRNRISLQQLYLMRVTDLVMLEKLSGEELDRKGLERR